MEDPSPALTLRDRPFWEAVDTGVLLARKWYPTILVFYAVPMILIGALVCVTLGGGSELPWVAALVLWWLRPLGDRLILGWAGELFFHPNSTWKKRLLSTVRSLDRSFWADLTYRRFSPWASLLAPVSFLEKGNREQSKKRRSWLGKGLLGPLSLLAMAILVVESGLAVSVWSSIAVLFSPGLWGAKGGFDGELKGIWWLVLALGVQLLTQPLYALSCFALYVNTRTRKEGWDLALAFRSLRAAAVRPGPLSALLLLLSFLVVSPPTASAQSFAPPSNDQSPAPQALRWDQTVQDPVFGRTEPSWSLRLKKPLEVNRQGQPTVPSAGGLIGAETLRWAAILLGAGVLLSLIVYGGWTALGRTAAKKRKVEILPSNEKEESLAWREAVLRQWSEGQTREAMSALYQAALNLAQRRHGLAVPEAATEGDCLRLLATSSVAPSFSAAVSSLVRLWSETAWGGRTPTYERFEASVDALVASEAEGAR